MLKYLFFLPLYHCSSDKRSKGPSDYRNHLVSVVVVSLSVNFYIVHVIFFSKTTVPIGTKLSGHDYWMVLYEGYVFLCTEIHVQKKKRPTGLNMVFSYCSMTNKDCISGVYSAICRIGVVTQPGISLQDFMRDILTESRGILNVSGNI